MMGKYDHCIHEFIPEYTEWGDWCPSPQAYFRGEACMPGTNYHCGYQVIAGPTWMEEAHCHHGVEEYFVIIGANLENVWDWDAEIDVMLGEDIDHMEQFTIDRPVIVRIPPNLWHCPINFRKINKPILWQAVYLNGTWGKTLARSKPDGQRYFEFMGDGIQICRKNPNAKCSYCGRCFKEAIAAMAEK
ncbi:MAG: hypothetical protein GX111_10805 [Clostridiales bacterium]|jgi:mannose-6-phosphate isomerase-like protein (cupin superfamily)|nr:hypothetical protein [Clostridiales bacterium]